MKLKESFKLMTVLDCIQAPDYIHIYRYQIANCWGRKKQSMFTKILAYYWALVTDNKERIETLYNRLPTKLQKLQSKSIADVTHAKFIQCLEKIHGNKKKSIFLPVDERLYRDMIRSGLYHQALEYLLENYLANNNHNN